MKTIRLTCFFACCLAALACGAGYEKSESVNSAATPTVASSPSPSATEAAGGIAAREPGDTSTPEFEGTSAPVEKERANLKPVILKAVRAGKHDSFDRVVFEFEGNTVPGYEVKYIKKPVTDCGAGEEVRMESPSVLQIQIQPSQAHTDDGEVTLRTRQLSPNLQTIKEVKLICDFEAQVQWVLGLGAANRYRVLELTNPARLVVDIRH